jgi:hypothetical protein
VKTSTASTVMAYQVGSEAREQIELFVGRAEGLRRAMLAYINDTSDPRKAAQRESEGVSIVLDSTLWAAARVEQEACEEEDPWNAVLEEAIGTVEQGEERVSSVDLLSTVLGIHISKQRDLDYKRLSRCMRRLGWDGPKAMRIADKPTKGYSRSRP